MRASDPPEGMFEQISGPSPAFLAQWVYDGARESAFRKSSPGTPMLLTWDRTSRIPGLETTVPEDCQ